MFLNILLLLFGLALLICGANLLVDGGSSLAHRLKVKPIVIGLTIIAFGTSAPELVVNIISSVKGSSALALGNILGSNIFNILAILGVTSILVPLGIQKSTTWVEVPLAMLASLLILIFVHNEPTGIISRTEGICLLIFFLIFSMYTYLLTRHSSEEDGQNIQIKDLSVYRSLAYIIGGFTFLLFGGRMLVNNAVNVALAFGISERIIGLTIVSIGTSLPELATSVIAAHKKNADIAIGNVVGSNLFNTFFILGITSTILPVETQPASNIDIIINLISSCLLFLFIFTGKGRKINRWEGVIFLTSYIIYLIWLIQG